MKAPVPLAFATARLLLRAPEIADAPALAEALRESYDRMWPWLAWARDLPDVEKTAARLEAARRQYLGGQGYWLMLIRRSDGRLLGGSGLQPRPSFRGAFEIGYWVRTEVEGQGYVGEAVAGIVGFACRELAARRLEIRTVRENGRSVRVAERAGFRLETVLPREHRHCDGTLLDTLVFGRDCRRRFGAR